MPLNNKYVYFSSQIDENNPVPKKNPNSDFEINFSDPLILDPYTQVRLVNCAIDNNGLSVEIDDSNNIIGWSIGFPWYPESDPDTGDFVTNGFSYQKAKIKNGTYIIAAGDATKTDPNTYLAPAIQLALNESCSALPNQRGGFIVTIDANSIINIKLSGMAENYGIPEGAAGDISQDYINLIQQYTKNVFSIVRNAGGPGVNGAKYGRRMRLDPGEMPMRTGDISTYRGVSLLNNDGGINFNNVLNGGNGDRIQYFNSPPLAMQGDFDSVNPKMIAKVFLNCDDVDCTGQAVRQATGYGDAGDFVAVSIVSDLAELRPTRANSCLKFEDIAAGGITPVTDVGGDIHMGELARVIVHYDRDAAALSLSVFVKENDILGQQVWNRANQEALNLNDRLYIELDSKGPTVNSFQYRIRVYRAVNADPANFAELTTTNFLNYSAVDLKDKLVAPNKEMVSEANYDRSPSMRLVVGSTYFTDDSEDGAKGNFEDEENLMVCFNTDPQGGQFGFVAGAYRAAGPLTVNNADLGAMCPLVIYGDSSSAGDQEQLNFIANALTPPTKTNRDWVEQKANLGQLGANFGGQFFGSGRLSNLFIDGSNTFTAGATAAEAIRNSELPQYFFDLPDLPLGNKTGNQLFGKNNNFIAPVLLPSQTNSALKPDSMLYNNIENSYQLRVTNLRIRICELDGTPATDLKDYTSGCLEFRDNPEYKKEVEARENAELIAQRMNESMQQLIMNIKPFGPQRQ